MKEEEYGAILKEKVYPDYERLKHQAVKERLLEPKVVYGYFPCQSDGNDLIVYRPKDSGNPVEPWNAAVHDSILPSRVRGTDNPQSTILNFTEWLRFTFPRQRKGRMLCISDFFSSVDSGRMDVVAFHLVTMGRAASEHSRALFTSNNYKEYLYFHGLSVESAEALAELWHRKIRVELGIHDRDAVIAGTNEADIRRLFAQGYRGSRYSFGYPACPNLEDHTKLFELLRPERIGIELTEEFQLVPEQSTDAIIVHHPEARYFNV